MCRVLVLRSREKNSSFGVNFTDIQNVIQLVILIHCFYFVRY